MGTRPVPTWAGRETVPELAGEDVELWLVQLDVEASEHDRLRELLSLAERDRADGFRLDVHRRRYAVGRARLRQILAAYLDGDPARLELVDGPSGKPELAASTAAPRFNLAHSEDLAIVAVALRDVGVDLELVDRARRPRWSAIAARFFHEDEQGLLAGTSGDAGWVEFLRAWTLKEACLKAAGSGLVADPRSFSVAAVLEGRTSVAAVAGRRWRCEELRAAPGAIAALAAAA